MGKESNNLLHANTLCLGTHCFFRTLAPAGSDREALPGAAAVTPKDNVSMVAGGEMINRPVTETMEGPGAEPFISVWQSKENMIEQNGGQRSPNARLKPLGEHSHQKALSFWREVGRQVNPKIPGTTQGDQKEKDQSSPGGQEHGSAHQKYNSFSIPPKGSRSSQKSRWS